MTTRVKVRKRDAEQVLADVRRRFGVRPGEAGPTLEKDWAWMSTPAPYAVVWEEGPYEWAISLTGGGINEEEAALYAEFGRTAPRHDPYEAPGVFVEPITTWALGIYEPWEW